MASINLCDRNGCDAMVKGAALGAVQIVTDSTPDAERVSKEICPGCIADLMDVLETPPTTHRKQAYAKPWKRPEDEPDDTMKGVTTEQLAAELFQRTLKDRKAIEGSAT